MACGMVIAAQLSRELGYISDKDVLRLKNVIESLHLPIHPPKWDVQRYLDLMAHDKKAEGGQIKYVVLTKLGQAKTERVDDAVVAHILELSGAA